MSLPVLIAHTGYHPYLEFTLRQAVDRAGRDGVVFLGDAANNRFPFVRFVDGSAPEFRAAAARIEAVYEHMSTNTRAFELSAIARWFRLRALMEREGLDRALVLDSDVLLFADTAALTAWFKDTEVALATPEDQPLYGWESSGHSAFWTFDALGACCDYAVQAYTDPGERARLHAKWQHHLDTGAPGGICDMTLFYLFAETVAPSALCNVTAIHQTVDGPTTFDHNVSMTLGTQVGDYALGADGLKVLDWREDQPYAVHEPTAEAIRFLSLHLQGPSKRAMGALYRGPDFEGRDALGRKLRRLYRARGLAGRVKNAAWTGVRRLLRSS